MFAIHMKLVRFALEEGLKKFNNLTKWKTKYQQ